MCGCACCPKDEPAFGANEWTITEISTGSTQTIYTCALFAPLMGLESNAGNLVGKIVTNKSIEKKEPPEIIPTNIIGTDNKEIINRDVPLMGGDSGLVSEVADIGMKYYAHDMGDKKLLDRWLKYYEKYGGVYKGKTHGLFFKVTDSRGGPNMSSNLGIDKKFWDMMKENVKSHEQMQEFMELYKAFNNVTSCWLVQYLMEQEEKGGDEKKMVNENSESGRKRKGKRIKKKKRGGEKGSNKKSRRKSGSQGGKQKKKRWGIHTPHPDGQYCGMSRAILSFSCSRKIMRLEDRETGRWFDMLVQHGSIVEMNRRIGGVSDKRWWHSVRGAEGSYTLVIEFSPKKKK